MAIVKNLDNIKKVLDHIESHPDEWDQTAFHDRFTHCFAGWAEIFATGERNSVNKTRQVARMYLGLTKR